MQQQIGAVRGKVRLRPVQPAGWWPDALLLTGFVALTVALTRGQLHGIDLTVSEWAYTHDPDALYWTARVLNFLGQGGWLLLPLAGGLAGLLALRTRSVRPLLLVAAAFVLIYLTVGPVKLWTDRAAPSATVKSPYLPPEEAVEVFNDLPPDAYGMSYPSGHVVNTIVWYGVIALLLAALSAGRLPVGVVRAIRLTPPAIVLATTTYLNFHWLTDGIAALLIGLLLDRIMIRLPWDDLPLPGWLRGWDGPALDRSRIRS